MLKMKLPMRTAEEGDHMVEDQQENTDCYSHTSVPYSDVSQGFEYSTPESCRLSQMRKEAVFEWFGLHLSPAKRIEFMYGLLHMCHPLELRFLGSCLEDLARKDVHVLDSELRANSQRDLGLLVDIADPVVLSKLLVCLSLLGSENRECAGTLYGALTHMDPSSLLNTFGVPLSPHGSTQNVPDQNSPPEWRTESRSLSHPSGTPLEAESGPLDNLALLFTMASLHPAFTFHQRSTVRHQLDNVERAIERRMHCHNLSSVQHYSLQREELNPGYTEVGHSAHCHSNLPNRTPSQNEAVHIEKIVLKRISCSQGNREYSIEVQWSDLTCSTVTKTHHELDEFLSKLPYKSSMDQFETRLIRLLAQGSLCEPRDFERALQDTLLSAPAAFRQRGEVCSFLCEDVGPGQSLQGENPASSGKTCKSAKHFEEQCTEPASQGKDLGCQPPGHQIAYSSYNPGQGTLMPTSSQRECQRPGAYRDHSGMAERRNQPGTVSSELDQHQNADEKCYFASEQKNKRRPDDKSKTEGTKIPNGVIRVQSPSVIIQRGSPKLVQDRSGDGWSESSSSHSSPRHEPRRSLENEELDLEEERDHHVHERKLRSHQRLKAVASLQPIVSAAYQGGLSHNCLSPHPLRLTGQDGMCSAPLQSGCVSSTEPIPNQTSLEDPQRARRASPPADLGSSCAPGRQRYRTQANAESRSTNPQYPMGAISVIPLTSHIAPLQRAHTSPDPAPTLTPPASLPNPGTRAPSLAVPSCLPNPTSTSAPSEATVTGQVQAPPPSAIPTHIHASSGSSSGVDFQSRPQQSSQPLQTQLTSCNSCGCSDGSGSGHSSTFYYPPQLGGQVFCTAHLPVFHVPSACNKGYQTQGQHQSNSPAQLPFYPPPHTAASTLTAPQFVSGPLLHNTPSDHVLITQGGYSLQQLAAAPFNRFYTPMYTSMGMKSSTNVSCYNCGQSGHYAIDCKQPSMDAGDQGGFQLKYTSPHTETPEKTE